MTTVSSIVAANRTGSAITFRLSVHAGGASADDKQYLYYDKSVAANDSLTIVIGITLNQTDVIKVYTSAVDMSFNMFGCETSNDQENDLARKRYLGERDETLDSMFSERDLVDRNTGAGRDQYYDLSRQIREARQNRILGGIKGLFSNEQGAFMEQPNMLTRKYPVPAAATGAASTMGFPGVPETPFGMGTPAQSAIPIEEILVNATKREVPETKPKFDIASKLGKNQIKSIKKRRAEMKRKPDAFKGDYAIDFLPNWLKKKYRNELLDYAGSFSPHESERPDRLNKRYQEGQMIGEGGALFDTTDPTDYGLMALGMAPIPGARIAAGAVKLRKLAKLKSAMNPKNMKINPMWTQADAPLTWAQLAARQKSKAGLLALQPTKEGMEQIAERASMKSLNPVLLSSVGGLLGIGKIKEMLMENDETLSEEDATQQALSIQSMETGESPYNSYQQGQEYKDMINSPDYYDMVPSSTDEGPINMISDSQDSMDTLYFMDERGNPISDEEYYSPQRKAGGGQLMGQAQQLANAGRGEDTMLMHVTPSEVHGLASLAPGMMTINPQTGLPEAGFLKDALSFAAPFLGSMVGIPPWATSAIMAKARGGDWKDMALGAATGALMGKLGDKLSTVPDIGATNLANEAATTALSSPETFSQAMQGVGQQGFTDLAAKAAIDPNLLQTAVSGGADPLSYLSTVAKPAQISSFASGLSDVAQTNLPNTFGQNIKNIGAGLPAVKGMLMSPEGLGSTIGIGLQAQNDMTRRYEQSLVDLKEQSKRDEEELYRLYPENIPYRGGGSIYKNRYINNNWS